MRLPSPEETAALLPRLGVSADDATTIIRGVERGLSDPGWRLDLGEARAHLVESIGKLSAFDLLPGELVRRSGDDMFALSILLSAVPDILSWHMAHQIPAEVSWETLSDLGRVIDEYRRLNQCFGFDEAGWMSLHFRGLLYQLGRLQYERSVVPANWGARSSTLGFGNDVLNVHIPHGGPLLPALCDESFRRAPEFFGRHLAVDYRVAVCNSWLLDPQLADYLPPSSNIVQFQRRFEILPISRVDNRSIWKYVFWCNEIELEDVVCATALQQAVVSHLRSGGQWHVRSGWTELYPSTAGGPRQEAIR